MDGDDVACEQVAGGTKARGDKISIIHRREYVENVELRHGKRTLSALSRLVIGVSAARALSRSNRA